jgi:seryl-tRNA synthetase
MIDPELLRKDFNDVAKRIRTRNRPYQQLDDFAKVDQE